MASDGSADEDERAAARSRGEATARSTEGPEERTRALARLARLSLSPDEVASFGAQLTDIVGYIEALQEVDITGVPEYLSVEQPGSALREDVATPPLPRELALAGAPATRDLQVRVPKFKED
ncbi:MAG: Asp-tRNA(Asn)/Glu-tRNA(Gln) amidotransferase subunit GatC [Myxococcales bacterium]|nr:Asp-tRNA(Asn)/Glu-tRNA(Gln) amidotransferase subunit GatC [Myxococcales bacterium]